MSAPAIGITRAQARLAAEQEHRELRNREAACRLNFLVHGDTFVDEDGEPTAHDTVCVCSPTCSRTYDPLPYAEAEPVDVRMYAGTGIGALYGFGMEPHHAADLAGWNIVPRSERYE